MVIDDIGYDRGWCSVDLLGSSRQTNRQRAPNSNDGSVTFACLTELGDTFKVSSRRLWYCQTIESTRHGASSCLPFIAVDLRGCDSVWTDDWCLLNALPWATQLLYYYSCSFFLARVAKQHILGSLLLSTGNGGCMQQSLANAVHGDATARHVLVVGLCILTRSWWWASLRPVDSVRTILNLHVKV